MNKQWKNRQEEKGTKIEWWEYPYVQKGKIFCAKLAKWSYEFAEGFRRIKNFWKNNTWDTNYKQIHVSNIIWILDRKNCWCCRQWQGYFWNEWICNIANNSFKKNNYYLFNVWSLSKISTFLILMKCCIAAGQKKCCGPQTFFFILWK